MQKVQEIKQISKYIITGGFAFVTEYGSFLLLISVLSNNNLIASQSLSFCLGLLVSFLGSRQFTFRDKSRSYQSNKKLQLTSYVALALFNLFVGNLLIHILVEYAGLPSWIAKVITMGSVATWNFIIFKRLIFKTV